jgi:hypothetical protein
MRIVTRFVGIITVLLWVAGSGAMGQQSRPSGPSERLTWSMNASQSKGGWKFGYEHEIPHQYSIDELIHKDDNIDSWRELITVESFRRPQGASAEDVFDRLRSIREKECPAGIMQWTVIDKSTDSFVYEVIRTQPCLVLRQSVSSAGLSSGSLIIFAYATMPRAPRGSRASARNGLRVFPRRRSQALLNFDPGSARNVRPSR